METDDLIAYIIIGIIIFIVLFLVFREILCWYYKINERVKLLKRNNQLLELLLKSKGIEVPVED